MGIVQCCGYFGSTLLMFISSVVFICLLIAYVPYIRTFFYREGTCVIAGAIYTVQYACECGYPGCKSFYPCMLVYAKVSGPDVPLKESRWPVMVFDDDFQQIWIHSSTPELEERCSLRVSQCDKDEQMNRDLIERYRQRYGMQGQVLPCYYDANSLASRGVVLHKNIHWTLAFHVIFWPASCFMSGILICAAMCYAKKYRKRHRALTTEDGAHRALSSEDGARF